MTEKIVRHVMMSKKVALRHLSQIVTVRPHLYVEFPSQEAVNKLSAQAEEHFGSVIMDQFEVKVSEERIRFAHPEVARLMELDQIADEMGLETSGVE
jgi:hypothetical protein